MLQGDSIYLRPLERRDLMARVRWLNDPEIYQYLLSDFPVSLARTEQWFNDTILDDSKKHFSIVDRTTETLVGMTGLLQISSRDRNAQLYITLGERTFHGKRLPDEVLPLVLEYGFSELNLNKIYLWTIPENERGRHVYERNGFRQEAEMIDQVYCRGKFQTLIQHGILRSTHAASVCT